MCRVTIEVNERALQGLLPELSNSAAISSWAQETFDGIIGGLQRAESATLANTRKRLQARQKRKMALEQNLTPDQLYEVIAEEIDDIYANG